MNQNPELPGQRAWVQAEKEGQEYMERMRQPLSAQAEANIKETARRFRERLGPDGLV